MAVVEHSSGSEAESAACEDSDLVVFVEKANDVKQIKTLLESENLYDKSRNISRSTAENKQFALPVLPRILSHKSSSPTHRPQFRLGHAFLLPSKQAKSVPSSITLKTTVLQLLEKCNLSAIKKDNLLSEIPSTWLRHSNMVVFRDAFLSPLWEEVPGLWHSIAVSLKCTRIALSQRIAPDGFRTPQVKIVLGEDGWVEHRDNGVKYVFDVTRCMFSAGNISEKLRMASLDCRGETVVDLFAGVGYFTLPILVHGRARMVHACDWNEAAVEGLKRGLVANGVADRCVVHYGDNIQEAPKGTADRVVLGLIPTSERSWPTACACLKPANGGWLHVHTNVDTRHQLSDEQIEEEKTMVTAEQDMFSNLSLRELSWHSCAEEVASKISSILNTHRSTDGKHWTVTIDHIECVKSYAPHVDHIVVDLECRPGLL